jgi:REP element-mobilizing transposase RayT
LLDEAVIMPNHIRGILILEEPVGATRRLAPTPHQHSGPLPGSVVAIFGQFKSQSAKCTDVIRGTPGERVWQRNYYEHVIRNEYELLRAREHITNNPSAGPWTRKTRRK